MSPSDLHHLDPLPSPPAATTSSRPATPSPSRSGCVRAPLRTTACCTSPPAAPGCGSTPIEPSDLTTLLLRAACDCAEHRQAGATGRVVLNPGAVALEVHELDGAEVFGWRGHEAACSPSRRPPGLFESLLRASPAGDRVLEHRRDGVTSGHTTCHVSAC